MSDDRLLIRELVENWVVWRDAGDWERFATVWHPEGFMMATLSTFIEKDPRCP